MTTVKGYTVLTQVLSGWELVWRTGEGEETLPEVFDTERAAQYDICADITDDIDQFFEHNREYDEIHQFDEYLVAEIEITEDGKLTVFYKEESPTVPGLTLKGTIIETDIETWRKGL